MIDNRLVLKSFKNLKMARSICKRNSVKASAANPFGKPPPGDKCLGLEPDIHFYLIKDGDNTE